MQLKKTKQLFVNEQCLKNNRPEAIAVSFLQLCLTKWWTLIHLNNRAIGHRFVFYPVTILSPVTNGALYLWNVPNGFSTVFQVLYFPCPNWTWAFSITSTEIDSNLFAKPSIFFRLFLMYLCQVILSSTSCVIFSHPQSKWNTIYHLFNNFRVYPWVFYQFE